MNEETDLAQNQEACARLGELTKLFGSASQAAAQSVCKAPDMLPQQIERLDALLAQMRRQARQMRACQLGLRLVQGGLSRFSG